MIRKLKDNWDLIIFVYVHVMIFVYLITGMQYFMLDLPTSMIIKKNMVSWGFFICHRELEGIGR